MMPQIDGFSPDGGSPRDTKPECRFFHNLGELVNLADEYRRDADSSRRKGGEGGCTYWFRGEEAFFPDLQPGLFRSGGEHESEFYQSALSSAPERFRGLESVFDRLTLMRHYGYPVRLLDISQNILTVWFMALDAWRTVRNDIACVHPGSPCFPGGFFPCPRISVIRVPDNRVKAAESDLVTNLGMLAKVGDEFSFGKLWHEVRQERRDFDEGAFWDSVDEMFGNWCVKPRMSNTRVDMQQGAFVLFGLHRDALRGEPIEATRDAQYPLRKSWGRPYNRILPTERAEPDEISLAGYLVPDGAAVAAVEGGNRDTARSQMERYVRAALRELETCGVMERVVYRDDLERHARYWEDHYRRG